MSYRIPSDIEVKMNKLIANKVFNARSEIISTSLRFYFDHQELNIEKEIEKFLMSEKGENYIKDLINKYQKVR